jgi:hypothetical protein
MGWLDTGMHIAESVAAVTAVGGRCFAEVTNSFPRCASPPIPQKNRAFPQIIHPLCLILLLTYIYPSQRKPLSRIDVCRRTLKHHVPTAICS